MHDGGADGYNIRGATIMAKDSKAVYKVTCTCGAKATARAGSIMGPLTCGWCGATFRIVVKPNPKTGAPMVTTVPANAQKADAWPTTAAKKGRTVKIAPVDVPAPPKQKARTKIKEWPRVQGTLEDGIYKVTCKCNARIRVHPRDVKRIQSCAWCGLAFKVAVPEPKMQAKRTTGPALSPPSLRTAPVPRTSFATPQVAAQELLLDGGMYKLSCTCGAENRVAPNTLEQVQTCFWCHGKYQITVAVDPRTGKQLAVTLPISARKKPPPLSRPQPKPPPPPPMPSPSSSAIQAISSSVLEAHCPCGAHLRINRSLVGKRGTCPECGSAVLIEGQRDANGKVTRVNIKRV